MANAAEGDDVQSIWYTRASNARTETYTVPQILQAYDSCVTIWLGEALHTRETWNPFENYMDMFKGVKNDADAIKNRLKTLNNLTPEQVELKELDLTGQSQS